MAQQTQKAPKQGKKKGGGGKAQGPHPGQLSIFPPRPPRTNPPPGRSVMLISNLFKLSIDQRKPIYKVSVNIEEEKDKSDKAEKGGDPIEKLPKKLSKTLRCQILGKAIEKWISTTKNPPGYEPGLKYNYVPESSGSCFYALFDVFFNVDSSEKALEFNISIELSTIVGGKSVMRPSSFIVKFHRDQKLDIQQIFEYCQKKGSDNHSTLNELTKAVGTIIRGQIIEKPVNIVTQFNVFPFKKDPEYQFDINNGVMINKGYGLTVKLTECGPTLNISNTLAAFLKEMDLVDLLQRHFNVRNLNNPLTPDMIDRLKRELLNKQVEARHINYGTKAKPHYRKYRVNDITGSSRDKFMLVDRTTNEAKQISIQDYFKKEYNYILKYPNLPCIVDKGRKVPLEICHLIDKQRVLRKMTPDETAEIIKKSAVKPEKHFDMIRTHVNDVVLSNRPLKDFGLNFEPRPIKVEGREVTAIPLLDGFRKPILPKGGQYDASQSKFVKSAVIGKWWIVFLIDGHLDQAKKELDPERFSRLYVNAGKQKGVSIGPAANLSTPAYLPISEMNEAKLKSNLMSYFSRMNAEKVDHAIIVLPNRCPDWLYSYIQYCEVTCKSDRKEGDKWTRTSCIKYQNYVRKIIQDRFDGKMFIGNLWLKHNTKLGGVNFVLQADPKRRYLSDGYIFVSVDVCHPAPGDRLIQSVAAVVGMWDLHNPNMSFCTRQRVQKKTRENQSTIEEVGEIDIMFQEILEAYKHKKGRFPSHVVIIRDGVSEGQFRIVLEYELAKIQASLVQKYALFEAKVPPLTCMVVQKRHKVRFMREKPVQIMVKGQTMNDYNIQPGTIVDQTVTHPTDHDFYIAPHKALQGTARAAHVYMILDDNKFSQDEVQEMILALSYLSPRCTKSTSIPTPVNLADLAAERGKNIVISWNEDNKMKMNDADRLKKLNNMLSNMADINYKNTLYYV